MTDSHSQSSILLYQADDGRLQLDVFLEEDTVWLTQDQMATLFGKAKSTINEHIKNIYAENELGESDTIKKFGNSEFQQKAPNYYNLDVIISVGYRVKSLQGTQFRKWATQRLKEYMVKGFCMDDERLKQGDKKTRYFQELLQRIRDIRSSERNFYQKVTDIYATSIDYQSDAKLTQTFFATVQNKMHYAVHGQTAAEMIANRADSSQPLMGLVNFKGNYITAQDARIAKNYLTEPELNQLNLIVSLYLDFAELQATNGRLMKMNDWIKKLDDFLKISEKEVLTHAGSVSAKTAQQKADQEFETYRANQSKSLLSDFDTMVNQLANQDKQTKTKEQNND